MEMAVEDRFVERIDHRRLRRPAEKILGLAHEVLIEASSWAIMMIAEVRCCRPTRPPRCHEAMIEPG